MKIIMLSGNIYKSTIENLDKISILMNIFNKSKNKANICINISDFINDVSGVSDISDTVITFIFEYASLYPAKKEEYPAPEKFDINLNNNFKHRTITTLLNSIEVPIFQTLINDTDDLQRDKQSQHTIFEEDLSKFNILFTAMQYAELLNMKILFEKLGAVISMYLKDKNVNYIYKLINNL